MIIDLIDGVCRLFRERCKMTEEINDINSKEEPDYDHNEELFAKFYANLKNGTLPTIPTPTFFEVLRYKRKRKKQIKGNSPFEGIDRDKLLANHAIPVEVEIWVDKVFDYYFESLIPMLGLVHWCQGAKKALYKYRGYDWYTMMELYPDVYFD